MRLSALSTCFSWAALLALWFPAPAPSDDRPKEPASAWKNSKVERLQGLKVTLSVPMLVARSKGFLWFSTLLKRDGGELLAVMSNYADVHTAQSTAAYAWSRDGGLTWSKTEQSIYCDVNLRLPTGDDLLLP
jgi:hypothetical protein